MRINSVHGNVVFRKGPDNDEIQGIIIDEMLLDTDIQMLYELLCIDKERLISKMRYKPGAADEYIEARRAECIKRKETAEPEPEPESEPEQPKRKCMTEEEKRERIRAYQKEYQKRYREKMKQKKAEEKAKKIFKKNNKKRYTF